MNAVDTNVLIYARDPRDPRKNAIARSTIENLVDGVLLWQVACEYISASRKLIPHGFAHEQAWNDLRTLRRYWPTLRPKPRVLAEAERLYIRYSLSTWDSFLIAACLVDGVKRLYSEDFGDHPSFDGLEIVDPFA